jgi:hypothetical protein
MSFNQNVALIVITAGLTGLLVPTVKAFMDQRHYRRQKDYETDLTRQTAILEAQVELLETLSDVLWEYVLSLIEVSYYKCNGDEERFSKALDAYEDESGPRFGRMQAEFSKARRLVSPDRWRELQDLYAVFLKLDTGIASLRASEDLAQWSSQHNAAFGVQNEIGKVLADLASEMQLLGPKADPSVTPS